MDRALTQLPCRAAHAGTSAFNWFIPGLLIQTAVFGGAFVGFGLIAELRAGVVERMRVTPMSRIAMLFGRSLRDVVILVAQALVMMAAAIPFGLRIDPTGAAVTIGLVALIGLALSPLSYSAALVLKSEDALAPVVNFVALLGWNPTADREIFTMQEMIQMFDLEKVNKAGAIFDVDKLNWMNGMYLRQLPVERLAADAMPLLKEAGYDNADPAYVAAVVDLIKAFKDGRLPNSLDDPRYFNIKMMQKVNLQ